MNGRLSRRIPIPLSTPDMRPGPNRAIAIRRSVSAKNAPMHPLGPRLETTCDNAIESLTGEPNKPDRAPAKTTAPSSPKSSNPLSALSVLAYRHAQSRLQGRQHDRQRCEATGRLSALALSWPFSNHGCNRLGIAPRLSIDGLRRTPIRNARRYRYTCQPDSDHHAPSPHHEDVPAVGMEKPSSQFVFGTLWAAVALRNLARLSSPFMSRRTGEALACRLTETGSS